MLAAPRRAPPPAAALVGLNTNRFIPQHIVNLPKIILPDVHPREAPAEQTPPPQPSATTVGAEAAEAVVPTW